MKPVAWIKESEIAGMSASAGLGVFEWKTNLGLKPEPGDVPLYTAPREWIGLTEEESISLLVQAGKPNSDQPFTTAPEMAIEFGRLVNERLKEKNHG